MNDECISKYNWCGFIGDNKPRNHLGKTFLEWVHERFDNYSELDRKLQWKLQDEWYELQGGSESSNEDTYQPVENSPDSNDKELIEEFDEYLNVNHYFKYVDKKRKLS